MSSPEPKNRCPTLNVLPISETERFRKKGIERNLLAKKFIQKILYSKQSIDIALFYHKQNPAFNRILEENPKDFQKSDREQSTALLPPRSITSSLQGRQGGAEIFSEAGADPHSRNSGRSISPFAPEKDEFVIENTSASIKAPQTFSIILPNLIHNLKTRGLKN